MTAETIKSKKEHLIFISMLCLSMVIWGGSWVSAKAIANLYPAETLTFWRFFINFLCFLPIVIWKREDFVFSIKALLYTLLGAMSMGLYFLFFFKGLKEGYAGVAGVLVTSMIPFATALLTAVLFKQRFSTFDIIGIALGILGGLIILQIWLIDLKLLVKSGNIYFIICPFLWALVTVCSQRAGNLMSPYIFSFFTYTMCSAIFLFLALPQGLGKVFSSGVMFWFNMLYLAVISSTFATTVYFVASSRLTSYKTSSYVFIVPTSAMLLSWIFLGETPRVTTIIGGVLAVIATYLINLR